MCQYLSFLNIFSIDFACWKGAELPDSAYIVIINFKRLPDRRSQGNTHSWSILTHAYVHPHYPREPTHGTHV